MSVLKAGCGAVVLMIGGLILISGLTSSSSPRPTPRPVAKVQPVPLPDAPRTDDAVAVVEQPVVETNEPTTAVEVPQRNNGSSSQAIVAARDFVRRHLKFPDDAEFPWFDGDARFVDIWDAWKVNGEVEAKNELGLSLTHRWSAVLSKTSSGWQLQQLRIGDEFVFDTLTERLAREDEVAEAETKWATRKELNEQARQKRLADEAEADAVQERVARARIAHATKAITDGEAGSLERKALQKVIDAFPADHELHQQAAELLEQLTSTEK